MADIFKSEDLKERKSLVEIFMEYRHYRLEESEVKKIQEDTEKKEKKKQEDSYDDTCFTINLKNSAMTNVEDELKKTN